MITSHATHTGMVVFIRNQNIDLYVKLDQSIKIKGCTGQVYRTENIVSTEAV